MNENNKAFFDELKSWLFYLKIKIGLVNPTILQGRKCVCNTYTCFYC